MSKRFLGRGYEYEDLYEYGCIGLIKAVDRFEPSFGVAFSTYAVPLIVGEIKRFLRGDGAVHISRTIRENAAQVIRCMDEEKNRGNHISVEQLSKTTGLDRQEVLLALSSVRPTRSLSEPVAGEGELLLQDMIGVDEGERVTDHIALKQALAQLNREEQTLIIRRYYQRHTQSRIGSENGMTQVQVSRMEKKVLLKLRELLEKESDVGL